MRSKLLVLLFVFSLLTGLGIGYAQDGTPYTLPDSGIVFTLPDDWEEMVTDDGFVYFTSEQSELGPYWYSPDDLEEAGIEPGDIAGTLENLWTDGFDLDKFDPDGLGYTTVMDQDLVVYSYMALNGDVEYEGLLIGMVLENDMIFIADIYSMQGEKLDQLDVKAALEMVAGAQIAGGTELEIEAVGAALTLPQGWEEVDEDGMKVLMSQKSRLTAMWLPLGYLEGHDIAGDVPAAMAVVWGDTIGDDTFDSSKVEQVTVGEQDVFVYEFTTSNGETEFERMFLGVVLENGMILVADVYAIEGVEFEEADAAIELVASARPLE